MASSHLSSPHVSYPSVQASTQAPTSSQTEFPLNLSNINIAAINNRIWKLPSDNRTYVSVQLENGVGIFFIGDPTALNGGVSISFETGFFNDPVNLQGLAHFHEHMVLMGTKRYPGNKSLKEFTSGGGGFGNAETSNALMTFWYFISDSHVVELAKR